MSTYYRYQNQTAGATTIALPFTYYQANHVRLEVNGELRAFAWLNDSTLSVAANPLQAGDWVLVSRHTSRGERLVNYFGPSQITKGVLDTDSIQAFYLAQEAYDRAQAALTPKYNGDIIIDGRLQNVSNPVADQDAATRIWTIAHVSAEVVTKADSVHTHDGRYYTETEVDAFLAGKSDLGHIHDARYYTELEIDSFLAGKSNTSHTHDDRYYTEAEINAFLAGKQDDLPSLTGNAGKALVVNSTEDGLLWQAGGGGGVTIHADLQELAADDHLQYHTDARGDARYYQKTEVNNLLADKEDNLPALTGNSGKVLTVNGTEDGLLWQVISSGVNDHGAFAGLADDDHPQYHNNARGDARYYQKSEVDTQMSGKSNTGHTHDDRYYTEAEIAASLAGYFPRAGGALTGSLKAISSIFVDSSSNAHYWLQHNGNNLGLLYYDAGADVLFLRKYSSQGAGVSTQFQFTEDGFIKTVGRVVSNTNVWTTLTLLNGWQNSGAPYRDLSCYITATGVVHVSGRVRNGTMGAAVATLPVGYRPTTDLVFPLTGWNTTYYVAASLQVLTNGNIIILSGGTSWNPIEISFNTTA